MYFIANWKMYGKKSSISTLNIVINYLEFLNIKRQRLFIFAILFVLPPLKTLPIPQKTNGIIIIPTRTPASLPFEKFLSLFSIKNV